MEYDKIRTDILNAYKIEIIRFTNTEIRKNFRGVCESIDAIVNQSLSQLNENHQHTENCVDEPHR